MSIFLTVCLIVVAILIAVGLYRVWAGPTVFDRLIAIALVSVNGVVVMVLLGFVLERPSLFLDIALGYALLAFLFPIALGRYFEERDDGTSRDGLPSPSAHPRPTGIIPHGWVAERSRQENLRRTERDGLIVPSAEVGPVRGPGPQVPLERPRTDPDGPGDHAEDPTQGEGRR